MLLEALSMRTGLTRDSLVRFGASSGLRYKTYEVDKRNGGKRLIEQPSKTVKMMQYLVIDIVFSKYPVHAAAIGYVKGGSILKNASAHSQYKFTTRLDFKDFFWSFKKLDIKRFFKLRRLDGFNLNNIDIDFISGLSTRRDRLVMGAPSSPVITNIMMYDLDVAIYEICKSCDVIYTRYADDIFISSNERDVLPGIVKNIIGAVLKFEFSDLQLNYDKTSHLSKKHHREVTGLVIKSDGGLSIGRDRKRKYKALIHQYTLGNLSIEDAKKLAGYLSWAYSVEPNFIKSLEVKYGVEVLKKIRSQVWVVEN